MTLTHPGRRALAAFLIGGWLAWSAVAHDGPEQEIEALTEEINKFGETPGRLIERAIEYRVLGRWAEATRDLERARQLDPGSLHAQRELGRVLFQSGKTNEAIESVTRALAMKPEEPNDLAALYALRAELLRSKRDYKKALEDCAAALQLHQANPDWSLLRSDLQAKLKQTKARLTGIEEGMAATGAGILNIELVEALIADQQFAAAGQRIEAELAESRVRSSWLIRRAQVELGMKRVVAATNDLHAALAEIAGRLNLRTPDAPLLLDKAVAHDLLGDQKEALRFYELARDNGADEKALDRIKVLKEEIEAAAAAATKDEGKKETKPKSGG